MPAGRPTVLTPKVIKQIAELFFLAFTDEQIAFATGISSKTIQRARRGEFCPAVKRAEFAKEKIYRQRVWDGHERWQGAAWFLERKYPTQFASPPVLLQVNASTTNVTAITITAPEAGKIRGRLEKVDSRIDQFLKKRTEESNSNGNGMAGE